MKQIAPSLCAARRLRCLSVPGSDGPFQQFVTVASAPAAPARGAHTQAERRSAASVVVMECRGLGNSLAPAGINCLPNEMGMASVGPSKISAGRHVALERPRLCSTTYSLDIRACSRLYIYTYKYNASTQKLYRCISCGGIGRHAETPAPAFVWTVNCL